MTDMAVHYVCQSFYEIYKPTVYFAYLGAYEPSKEAKEHETHFHSSPNYVKTFEI